MSVLIGLLGAYEQWGYSKSCTVKFHLPFPSQVFFCGIVLDTSYGYEFGPDQLAPKDLKPSGFTKYRDTFPNFWWFAIGKQQWGFIEKVPTSTKYIVPLNIAITKGIYGSIVPSTAPDTPMANNAVISISANNMIVQSMQGSIASLWWLSIGFQQWGRSTAATLNFSLSFQKFYCITTAQESWSGATFENTSWIARTNSSMIWPTYRGTNINYIAVGMQQCFKRCAFGKAQALLMAIHQNPAQPLPVS